VISRSGVVMSITNCYIRFTLLYFYFSGRLVWSEGRQLICAVVAYIQ